MALRKQAKVLNKHQVQMVVGYLNSQRYSSRNIAMFLLSVRAGLRAKEIGLVQWKHLVDSQGNLMNELHLPNIATKGNSGRVVPLHKDLKEVLEVLFERAKGHRGFILEQTVLQSQKGGSMARQSIINWFKALYADLGVVGGSSHSGRRTFATELGKRLSNNGCSIHDLSRLMGHSSIATTQHYLEHNPEGQKSLVNSW